MGFYGGFWAGESPLPAPAGDGHRGGGEPDACVAFLGFGPLHKKESVIFCVVFPLTPTRFRFVPLVFPLKSQPKGVPEGGPFPKKDKLIHAYIYIYIYIYTYIYIYMYYVT